MRDVAGCGPTPVGSPLNVTDIRVFEWGDRAEVRLAAERQGRARLHLSPIETARTQDTSASLSSRAKQGHPPRFGDLELVGNQTAAARATRTFDVGGARVSPTANLITFSRPSTTGGRRRCVALLGIGHTHRGTGKVERHLLKVCASRPLGRISAASRLLGCTFLLHLGCSAKPAASRLLGLTSCIGIRRGAPAAPTFLRAQATCHACVRRAAVHGVPPRRTCASRFFSAISIPIFGTRCSRSRRTGCSRRRASSASARSRTATTARACSSWRGSRTTLPARRSARRSRATSSVPLFTRLVV